MGMAKVRSPYETWHAWPKCCPFCKSECLDMQPVEDLGLVRGAHLWQLARVYCMTCSAGGPQKDTEEEAILAWNERSEA